MRVLIKISGESLSGDSSTYDENNLKEYARQIKEICSRHVGIGVVIGGGNIVRGKTFEKLGFNRVKADLVGMLATTMNCMVLANSLESIGQKTIVMSAIKVEGALNIDVALANKSIEEDTVVLFGGGIGNPYFTTDTACALRAIEINANRILIAKNGTDGVYDKDPNEFKDAKRFDELSFDDILDLNLKVMDSTAASLCSDNNIEAFIFSANEKDCLIKAIDNKIVGTIIR